MRSDGMTEVFVTTVHEAHGTNPLVSATRPVCWTLTEAKRAMNEETKTELPWKDEFGGAIARHNGLVYDIRPEGLR